MENEKEATFEAMSAKFSQIPHFRELLTSTSHFKKIQEGFKAKIDIILFEYVLRYNKFIYNMWSYGKDRYISSMEELYETEEEKQTVEFRLYKLMYYSCCFTKTPPYNQNAKERESSTIVFPTPYCQRDNYTTRIKCLIIIEPYHDINMYLCIVYIDTYELVPFSCESEAMLTLLTNRQECIPVCHPPNM